MYITHVLVCSPGSNLCKYVKTTKYTDRFRGSRFSKKSELYHFELLFCRGPLGSVYNPLVETMFWTLYLGFSEFAGDEVAVLRFNSLLIFTRWARNVQKIITHVQSKLSSFARDKQTVVNAFQHASCQFKEKQINYRPNNCIKQIENVLRNQCRVWVL